MKDAPAVDNPGYAIDPQATADKGKFMLDKILTANQSTEIKNIYQIIKPSLENIVKVRIKISVELRKAIDGQTVSKTDVLNWSAQYGEFDGNYIFAMIDQFKKVGKTLTNEQKSSLMKLRDLPDFPCQTGKVFIFSEKIDEPVIPNTDFLFK